MKQYAFALTEILDSLGFTISSGIKRALPQIAQSDEIAKALMSRGTVPEAINDLEVQGVKDYHIKRIRRIQRELKDNNSVPEFPGQKEQAGVLMRKGRREAGDLADATLRGLAQQKPKRPSGWKKFKGDTWGVGLEHESLPFANKKKGDRVPPFYLDAFKEKTKFRQDKPVALNRVKDLK